MSFQAFHFLVLLDLAQFKDLDGGSVEHIGILQRLGEAGNLLAQTAAADHAFFIGSGAFCALILAPYTGACIHAQTAVGRSVTVGVEPAHEAVDHMFLTAVAGTAYGDAAADLLGMGVGILAENDPTAAEAGEESGHLGGGAHFINRGGKDQTVCIQYGTTSQLETVFRMGTYNAAKNCLLKDYGLAEGCRADLTIFREHSAAQAVISQHPRCFVIKDGKVIAKNGELIRA